MKVLGYRSFGAAGLLVSLLVLLSCGNDPRLVDIAVTPSNVTITGVDCTTAPCQPTVQYRAVGFYNHRKAPRDITAEVTWTTDTPSIIQFQAKPPGLLAPTGNGAGTNLGVRATETVNGSLVSGSAVVNVGP